MIARVLAVVGLVALLAAAPSPALATEDVHPDVAYALAAQPGGTATSWSAAEWPALGMELIVPVGRSVGSCPTNYICAYGGVSQGGTRLQWSSCGTKSTAALASVGSIANARSSGTLQARQGTTVRASASAGSAANVPVAYRPLITNVFC